MTALEFIRLNGKEYEGEQDLYLFTTDQLAKFLLDFTLKRFLEVLENDIETQQPEV